MRDFKYILFPFLIILIGSFLNKLALTFTVGSLQTTLVILITVGTLFSFGMSLNKSTRRAYSVWKIVLSVVLTVFLVLFELGYFNLPILVDIIYFFGVNSIFIKMMYILCGYMFVD